jgi:hypothetical protein
MGQIEKAAETTTLRAIGQFDQLNPRQILEELSGRFFQTRPVAEMARIVIEDPFFWGVAAI